MKQRDEERGFFLLTVILRKAFPRSRSRRSVGEPAHPIPPVGLTSYPLRGIGERVAASIGKGMGSELTLRRESTKRHK